MKREWNHQIKRFTSAIWSTLKPKHLNGSLNNGLYVLRQCMYEYFANFVHKIRRPDVPLPPTPLLIPHFLSALLELLVPPEHSCTAHKSLSICSFYHVKCFCGIFTKLNTKFYRIATLQVVFTTWLHAVHWSLWQAACDLPCSGWCPSRLLQRKKTKLGTCVYDNCGKDIWQRQLSSTVNRASTRAVSKLLQWTSKGGLTAHNRAKYFLSGLEWPGWEAGVTRVGAGVTEVGGRSDQGRSY